MTKPPSGPRRLEGMRHPIRLVPFLFVLAIAACSASPAASTPPSPTSAAAASPSGSLSEKPGVTADYSGILSMDTIEGGCPFLQADNGDKLQVIYPDGWQLNKSPLELVAPDGSIHSKGGDVVSIKGSKSDEMVSICQIGPIIEATEVLDR